MTRKLVRIVGLVAVIAMVAVGCGDDDKEGEGGTADTEASGSPTTAAGGTTPPAEVDRTGRFSKLDSYCEPAADPPSEPPQAVDDGITADSVSIAFMRVTLEDLEAIGFGIPIGDTADQARKFVGIINDRCGGIYGRKLDLSIVEAPPLAPEGQDPSAIAQGACIKAAEDNNAVFAYSGTGWGGQGGASCLTNDHDTIYITTYNIADEDLDGAENRLYSTTHSSADGLEYLARVLDSEGAFEGKTIGVVHSDAPGDPEIVQAGLVDTLTELGHEPVRVSAIGCGGGNNCTTGIAESVTGMISDNVDVIFPLLNVISLPGYITEMVTQGVKPGDVQFYQSSYNAQSGDLVSSKVIAFGGEDAGNLYNKTEIIAPGQTGTFRLPGFEPGEYSEMCNREYQEAGGDTYEADDPETNSSYGATTGTCTFIRIIARALDAAGPNPTREDLAAAVENLGAIDLGGVNGSFAPGKYTAPDQLGKSIFNYPCPPDMKPFDQNMCILPEGDLIPIPSG
jgi:hypothetical protein